MSLCGREPSPATPPAGERAGPSSNNRLDASGNLLVWRQVRAPRDPIIPFMMEKVQGQKVRYLLGKTFSVSFLPQPREEIVSEGSDGRGQTFRRESLQRRTSDLLFTPFTALPRLSRQATLTCQGPSSAPIGANPLASNARCASRLAILASFTNRKARSCSGFGLRSS
jgi:hypothetical protein